MSASGTESRINGNLRGIFWMAMTGILFVMVTGIVRHLGTDMNAV